MTDRPTYPYDRLDDATIARYLSGTCGPAELAQVERWLNADPTHRDELATLQAAWNPRRVAETDPEDRMWRWVAARMDESLPRLRVVPAAQASPTLRSYLRRYGLIAAALLVVAGGALLLRLPEYVPPTDASILVASAGMREFVTPRGVRATRNLPDGTRVILGPDSRLRIPASFATTRPVGGVRDVYLQGEAFFQVTHDSMRPFRVHTANGIAEDLGTEFVVTAYPETGTTRVVVSSGIVALRARANVTSGGLTLRAGDLGRIETSGAATLARNVDVAAYVGWTMGDLVFDEVPLQDAITRLGRWYDMDIQLADTALPRRRFTAAFHDEPIQQVIRVLELALDVRAERTGQRVVLRPRHSATTPSH